MGREGFAASFLHSLKGAGIDPVRVLVGGEGVGFPVVAKAAGRGAKKATEDSEATEAPSVPMGKGAGAPAARFAVAPLEPGSPALHARLFDVLGAGKPTRADPPGRGNAGVGARGRYIVYWMLHNRRERDNAALAVAQRLALSLGLPLLAVEGLTSNYPWASARQHGFVAEGVEEHLRTLPGYLFVGIGAHPSALAAAGRKGIPDGTPETAFDVRYPGGPPPNAGVLPAVFESAAIVVTDWAPWYIFPGLAARTATALGRSGTPCLLVDDCGVVPLFRHAKAYTASRFIRPKLAPFVARAPAEAEAVASIADAFASAGEWVSAEVLGLGTLLARAGERAPVDARFVVGSAAGSGRRVADGFAEALTRFAGLEGVGPAKATTRGGETEASARFAEFLAKKLKRYDEDRNHPDLDGTSRISAHLHYGMVHPRTLVRMVLAGLKVRRIEEVEPDSPAAKFLDELLTWRELGLDMAHFSYLEGTSLGTLAPVPGWAVKSLRQHMGTALQRPVPFEDLEGGRSPDPVWNAAQKELARTGALHNYMRMVWGKGIVRWSASPEEALERLEYLNNKYALDGRDPNSYTGIYWCLGKFDRPWPPARPPFGLVRSMNPANARKKLAMEKYLVRFP